MNNENSKDITLKWYGHSSFKVKVKDTILFFDPVRKNDLLRTTLNSKEEKGPHAIFISHEHWDHCDPKTILELASQDTKIYGPSSIENPISHEISFMVSDYNELKESQLRSIVVKEDDTITLNGITIKCLKAKEGLSYLVSAGKTKLLFMGDSIATKKMTLEEPDVILFPIWAVFGEEAKLDDFLALAQEKLCIPMHYHESPEALPNFYTDLNEVLKLLPGINIKILERNRPITL